MTRVDLMRRNYRVRRIAYLARWMPLATVGCCSWDMADEYPAMGRLLEESLTGSVIGAFYEVYNTLGFGFLEHIYVMALERELITRGHKIGREVGIRVRYKGDELGLQRIDMLVDEKLIVEVKSTYELHKAAPRQVYNYLRATNLEVGLLLFFGPKPSFFRLISSNKRSAASVLSAASGRLWVIDASQER